MARYALPIFLGAFLLFQVQPLIARCILPWFGGTPAVWTTCMLVFQMLLLAGYAYAHYIVGRLRPAAQIAVHAGVVVFSVALVVLLGLSWGAPLVPDASWKPQDPSAPVMRIIWLLLASVGAPYFVLSTTSPLLQAWCVRGNPTVQVYRLYTLSNIGSLLALVTYPFLVEPYLALRAQAYVWAGLYVLYAAGCLVAALTSPRNEPEQAPAEITATPRDETRDRVRPWAWVLLPALASVLLLATTNSLCQEVAVFPFLWILPLALYLLTFIICFDSPRWYDRRVFIPLVAVMVPVSLTYLGLYDRTAMWSQVTIHSLALFAGCMVCHGETVRLRPAPSRLTGFYLAISVGGALGGLLVGIVAPLVFPGFWEMPLSMTVLWVLAVLLGLLRLPTWWKVAPALALIPAAYLGARYVWPEVAAAEAARGQVLAVRNFYGVLKVREVHPDEPLRRRYTLVHGRTVHGFQFTAPSRRMEAASYYGPQAGICLATQYHPRRWSQLLSEHSLRVGVVGLGAGALAAWGREGDDYVFYEINPAVPELSGPDGYFTYLRETPAHVEVVMGDGRISLERELQEQGSREYDIIALDAFSSDAVPAHLLTAEAFALYLQHLRQPDGILAVHISNRWLDLQPVVWGLAEHYGLRGALIKATGNGEDTLSSEWILLTHSEKFLGTPEIVAATALDPEKRRVRLWTDDYYNLFQILK